MLESVNVGSEGCWRLKGSRELLDEMDEFLFCDGGFLDDIGKGVDGLLCILLGNVGNFEGDVSGNRKDHGRGRTGK